MQRMGIEPRSNLISDVTWGSYTFMVHGVKLIIDNIVIESHVRYRHQMLHICLKSLLLKYS